MRYVIDRDEVKEKSKYGSLRYYIDGSEIKDKKYGNVKYYIDGSLTKDQLYGFLSII